MTEGRSFKDLPSEKYPLPLMQAVYRRQPAEEQIRRDVRERMDPDPVSILENALVLFELYETGQAHIEDTVLDDAEFLGASFQSKRLNGWISVVGDADPKELETAVNEKWQFRFFHGASSDCGLYAMLNLLARYGFVYGKIQAGDFHGLSHFVEDHAPGLIICRGKLSDLELTLSLMAMKMGIPAIVPEDYPFPLGRTVRTGDLRDIVGSVALFPNIRRLLPTPDIPRLPSYCDPENAAEEFTPQVTWGDTPESFYILRKGAADRPATSFSGQPEGPMGIIVTVDAEPLDGFDCRFIESRIARNLSMMKGVKAEYTGEQLQLSLSEVMALDPARVGEVLIASIQNEFPRIEKIRVEIIFDRARLGSLCGPVREERAARAAWIKAATEETADRFYSCTGCSPFAPDHVCVITPERPPQCGRPFGAIKTGALYQYDDMSNIHHSSLHRNINSFGTIEKGRCIDPEKGEWEGINRRVSELSNGRTPRVLLHSLEENPHTGCSCFHLIMFKTDKPRPGIGIMDREYEGTCPDGRSWKDLHYDLTGKQTPGMAGASPAYLFSPKFLRAMGGWKNVVWVSPGIKEGGQLPGAP